MLFSYIECINPKRRRDVMPAFCMASGTVREKNKDGE